MKYIINIFTLCSIIFGSVSYADQKKIDLNSVYKLLHERKFNESIENLKILSNKNMINAQLLYAKILLSGDIIPQDFENSYFWGFSALLGGLKKAENITNKLGKYLTEEQIESIIQKLENFLEQRAFKKDRKAIIQIAKLNEAFKDPPDMVKAYTWYNIAVAQGIKTAKPKRDKILDNLNEKDLLEAQTISIKLFNKINN